MPIRANKACLRGCRCNGDDDCLLLLDDNDDDAPPIELEKNEKKYKHIIKKIKEGRLVL